MTAPRKILSPAQRHLLDAALNRIIPPQDQRPGAGTLGIGDFIESVAAGEPGLTRLFLQGLAAIQIAAADRGTDAFAALTPDAQDAALQAVETSHAEFFDQLVLQAYNGYYTNPTVFQAIGYDLPPAPAPGDKAELLDETLLEAQRRRAPFWTRV